MYTYIYIYTYTVSVVQLYSTKSPTFCTKSLIFYFLHAEPYYTNSHRALVRRSQRHVVNTKSCIVYTSSLMLYITRPIFYTRIPIILFVYH